MTRSFCARPISTSRACASARSRTGGRRATSSATSGRSTTRWSRSRPRSAPRLRPAVDASAGKPCRRRATPGGTARFHWDVDFFRTDDGATYFALAEVEMPEERDRAAAAAGHPGAARPAAGAAQRSALHLQASVGSACGAAARRRAGEREDRMKIARINSIGQGPVHLRRRADRLRRAQLDDQQHPAGQGRDRYRHHRLGRGLLLRLHRRGEGGALTR